MEEAMMGPVAFSTGEELRIGEVVLAAAGLETGARRDYLRQLTLTQPALLEEARQRLARAAELPDEFLAVPAAELLRDTDQVLGPGDSDERSPSASLVAGTERYELGECLGRGGMARVYRAFDHQLHRSVALKFLDEGSPVAVEGFLREARFQASVSHDFVLDVYDTGELDGQPYIAMRLVEGTTLAALPPGTSPEQKVRLMAQVAEGLHAAHRNGLIHRDVKPSNVLVETSEEGGLKPWVTDFGIARGASERAHSEHGLAGTPAYLAPEMLARPSAGADSGGDRRADVYGLGATLYELLAGRPPLVGENVFETLNRIRSEEPEPLRSLVPEVPADLEAIVMRCLAKDPEARYPSARALAEDLHRFLDGEVVEAHTATLAYRLSRFAGRHRTLLLVAASGLLALFITVTAFAVSTSLQSRRVAREAATAEQVSDFLIGLFQYADPEDPRISAGDLAQLSLREVLDRGAIDLRAKLTKEPEVRARMLDVVGNVYLTLALPDSAEPLLREALELRRRTVGELAPAYAESLVSQASLERGRGGPGAGEGSARRAVEIYDQAGGGDTAGHALALRMLGSIVNSDGRPDEAEAYFERALELVRRDPEVDPLTLAVSLREASNIRQNLGKLEQAEEALLEAHRVQEQAVGSDHPLLAYDFNSLATLYHRQGRLDEAEAHYRRALAIRERHLGAEHPGLIPVLGGLGVLDYNRGRLEEAEASHRRALAICEKYFESAHPSTARALNNLAEVHREKDELDLAEGYFRRALAVREELGAGLDLGPILNNLALLYQAQGDFDRAGSAFQRAVAVFEEHLGAEHPSTGLGLLNLGMLRRDEGERDASRQLIERALSVLEGGLGPDHFYVALALEAKADGLLVDGEADVAAEVLRRARRILEASLPEGHWRRAAVESGLGVALVELEDFAAAESLLTASYPILLEENGAEARRVRRARQSLIELYGATGRPRLAEDLRGASGR